MKDIEWRAISRQELAALLGGAQRLQSRALGATTIYRLDHNSHEVLVMALPDGHALIIERAPQAKWRRRVDPQRKLSPESR